MDRLVIGITGPYGAGRTTAATHFAERTGGKLIRLSEFIRAELPEAARDDVGALQEKGDEVRSRHGEGALAVRAVDQMGASQASCFVVDGAKHPDEVAVLRQAGRFFLVAVEASPQTCWERVRRALGDDRNRFEQIAQRDRLEVDLWGNPLPHGQKTDDCVERADAFIWNDRAVQVRDGDGLESQDGTLARLRAKVEETLKKLTEPEDTMVQLTEVRMCQAYTVAQRSSCFKRKVGAVITNTLGFIVAEGYNEVPDGQHKCREHEGCHRDMLREQDLAQLATLFRCGRGECGARLDVALTCTACGHQHARQLPPRKNLDHCRAVHAEERAILQIARFGGIGIEGGTLYTTTYPCSLCAKKVVQTGLSKIVFMRKYVMPGADDCLLGADVTLEQFEGITPRAFHRLYSSM